MGDSAMASFNASLSPTAEAESAAFYDEWARQYDDDVRRIRYNGTRQLAELCRRHLSPTDRIVDIGGGTGTEALLLKPFGFGNIHCLDGSEQMLAVARSRDAFRSYTCEALQLRRPSSLETAHFDAMISVGCFAPGHLDARYLQEMVRPVRVGGKSIIGLREMWTSVARADAAALSTPAHACHEDLEAEVERLERAGTWRRVERVRLDEYSDGYPGVFYVHQILASPQLQ